MIAHRNYRDTPDSAMEPDTRAGRPAAAAAGRMSLKFPELLIIAE